MIRIFIIWFFMYPIEIEGIRRRCLNTGVHFLDTVSRSSIIVYGLSTGKRVYVDTEKELLFNVTFRVDCVFKGNFIESRIEITGAGVKEGRLACQTLDAGKFYVAFLEKYSSNPNVYYPLDFQERIADSKTHELLETTCHLSRTQPLNALTDNCPNVSTSESCRYTKTDKKILPKMPRFNFPVITRDLILNVTTDQPSIQLNETNLEIPSSLEQYADNPRTAYASLSHIPSVLLIHLAVHTAMFI